MTDGDLGGWPRFLTGLAVACAWRDSLVLRNRERARSFMRGLLTEALSIEELEELTVRLYDRAAGQYSGQSVQDWENAMFDRWLPPAPAHILVTAAGSGREARALIARGHAVDALEPTPGMAATCAAVPGIGMVVRATHKDLVAAVARGGGPATPLAERRYDAVLVGWGSFTHVLSREGQVRLLTACDRLAPSGPILLSFFARGRDGRRRVRAFAAGTRLGRRVGASRGTTSKALEIDLIWHLGFTHACAADEIAELAASMGRVAETTITPYGHAVLRPG